MPARRALPLSLLLAAVLLATAAPLASAQTWTTPMALATCGAVSEPKVVFPFSAPNTLSGEGAIVWLGVSPSCTDVGAGVSTIDAAGLHSDDTPASPRALTAGPAATLGLLAPLLTVTTTRGQIVAIAGSSATASLGAPEALLGEGTATSGLGSFERLGGPASLIATQDGFIGDADVASVIKTASGLHEIELRAQRHYASRFGPALVLPAGRAPITALALGMDFRADTLVVWSQAGAIWARRVTNDGVVYAAQRLGPSGYDPQISAVLSDDDRAFVLWTDEPSPSATGTTSVFLAHSAGNVIFHGATLLTSFMEPPGVRLTPGSVALERLSGEGVALAWPAMLGGFYVVEAAGVTAQGVAAPSILSEPAADLRLAAVATGPHNEIVVLAEQAPRTATGWDATEQAIFAARSNETDIGSLGFGALVQLAAPGPNAQPSVAVDPRTDVAVAAWQTSLLGVPALEWADGAAATSTP